MTLTEIRNEVRSITGVSSTSIVSDAIIDDLINEGQYQICDEANLLQGYATRNSVVGTIEYPMKTSNSDLVTDWTVYQTNLSGGNTTTTSLESMNRIYRVDFDDEMCQRIGINEITDISGDSSMSNITSSYAYYIHEDKLGIFPKPTEVKEIKIYFYRLPHVMFTDATCDTNSNTSFTMDNTSEVREGMRIEGAGIVSENVPTREQGTFVASITNVTTIVLSQASTATATNQTMTFGSPELDERYHRTLIYYPSWRVVERLRDIQLISYFKNEWLEQKQKIVMERQSRDGNPVLTIPYNDF